MDSIFALAIILSPLVFYAYLSFPKVKIWETFLFTYESHYYEDVNVFMWVFLGKFMWFYLVVIWYFTNRNWWKDAVLIPIALSLFQIINLLNDDVKFKDEAFDMWILIPIIIFICCILFYLRRKMTMYTEMLDLREEFNQELERLKSEEGHGL